MASVKTAKKKATKAPENKFLVLNTYGEQVGEYPGETPEEALLAAAKAEDCIIDDGDEYVVVPLSSRVKLRCSRPVTSCELTRV